MSVVAKDRARHATIIVRAEWDDEAGVWVASSDDVHGLSVESDTIESLQEKVIGALQDLIELNGLEYDLPEIPVHFMAQHLSRMPNPSCS